MPRMKKTMKAADAPGKDLPKIPVELIDHFVTPEFDTNCCKSLISLK